MDTIRDFLCARLWAKSRCYVADCNDKEPGQSCQHKKKIRELVSDLTHYENMLKNMQSNQENDTKMENMKAMKAICHCDWGRRGHESIECIILNLKESIIKEYRSGTC